MFPGGSHALDPMCWAQRFQIFSPLRTANPMGGAMGIL